jgi:hypothetical protein
MIDESGQRAYELKFKRTPATLCIPLIEVETDSYNRIPISITHSVLMSSRELSRA